MSIRVYLADDHAVVRDGLRSLLQAQGDIVVVGEAANGRQAVREVKQLKPDVVVMDITMPEMNGIDAAHEIHEALSGTQVVMLSMHATTEHIYRALQSGAIGYLLKESAGKEVVDAIRSVQGGHRYLSQRIADAVLDDYVHHRDSGVGRSPIERLSARERQILQLVVEGKSSAEIAKTLHLSPKTVETYRSRLMHKLRITDLPSLVKFCIQNGLTSLE